MKENSQNFFRISGEKDSWCGGRKYQDLSSVQVAYLINLRGEKRGVRRGRCGKRENLLVPGESRISTRSDVGKRENLAHRRFSKYIQQEGVERKAWSPLPKALGESGGGTEIAWKGGGQATKEDFLAWGLIKRDFRGLGMGTKGT